MIEIENTTTLLLIIIFLYPTKTFILESDIRITNLPHDTNIMFRETLGRQYEELWQKPQNISISGFCQNIKLSRYALWE